MFFLGFKNSVFGTNSGFAIGLECHWFNRGRLVILVSNVSSACPPEVLRGSLTQLQQLLLAEGSMTRTGDPVPWKLKVWGSGKEGGDLM